MRTASIIRAMVLLMMDVLRTSETSVHSNETARRYIPEDYKLHILSRESEISHFRDWF
jgi:hypothetical protein